MPWPKLSDVCLIVNSDSESQSAEKFLNERQIEFDTAHCNDLDRYKRLPVLLVHGVAYAGFEAIKEAADLDRNLR